MATTTEPAGTKQTIREYGGPALEALEENVRQARRMVVAARRAAEDLADGAALQVRNHPLGAVALAAGTGALVGCAAGLMLGWRVGGLPSAWCAHVRAPAR